MPQGPLGAYTARKLLTTALAPLFLDGTSKNLMTTKGGNLSALNLGAAAVIQAGVVRAAKLIILAPGSTSGAFTLNDCTTTAAAAASNQIFSLAYNATANVEGAIFDLDWPCLTGLVLSAVPGGGTPICAISYTY